MADHGQQVPDDARRAPRMKLPAMYTLCRVRPAGGHDFSWAGYVYDVSTSGMRFELDNPIDPGTQVDVHTMLPGNEHCTFSATGRVVRMHDEDDELGPVRMGMVFETFVSDDDRLRLSHYIDDMSGRLAA